MLYYAGGDFNRAAETMLLFDTPATPASVSSSSSSSSNAAAPASSSSANASSSSPASSCMPRQRPIPTRTPQTAFTPWLWARFVTGDPAHGGRADESRDLDAATREGRAYLERFSAERSSASDDCDDGGGGSSGLVVAPVAKRPRTAGTSETLTARRARASCDLHAIAAAHRVTCGKWCVFAPRATVDAAWAAIADATERGALGHASKVATDAGQERFLICVYTPDFQCMAEVGRILGELRVCVFIHGTWIPLPA